MATRVSPAQTRGGSTSATGDCWSKSVVLSTTGRLAWAVLSTTCRAVAWREGGSTFFHPGQPNVRPVRLDFRKHEERDWGAQAASLLVLAASQNELFSDRTTAG